MSGKPYHHGDLKQALIEKGLEIIKESGIENLSLRKTAEYCGVSSAAPYAHFKNKDELVNSIRNYVMELFVDQLNKCIESASEDNVLAELGRVYVMFFYHSPLYFDLLFSRKCMRIRISEQGKSDPPFELFKRKAQEIMIPFGLGKEESENKILAMWGMVHGLAAIAATNRFDTDIDWEHRITDIINSVGI
ncbi:MAG: TetR/AcrR family transcriptional regulator [Ruminiclostridium sp.]|nr:TetR/AcrR family transcriptional regulator [Ruminiclostridium sp.]